MKFIQDPFKIPDKSLGFRLYLVDGFANIIPTAFGLFIDHHPELLACVKCVFF